MFTPPILPPGGVPQPVPVPGAPGNSVLLNVPPVLRSLPLNALLQTTYTGADTRGNSWLATPQGKVQLNGQLPLSPGTTLALQVVQSGDQLVLKLIAVNGTPVQQQQSSPASPGNNSAPAASRPAANPLPGNPISPALPTQGQGGASSSPPLAIPLVFRSVTAAPPPPVSPTAPLPQQSVPLTPGTLIQATLVTPQLPALQSLFRQAVTEENRPQQLSSIVRRDGIPQFGVPADTLASSVLPGSVLTARVTIAAPPTQPAQPTQNIQPAQPAAQPAAQSLPVAAQAQARNGNTTVPPLPASDPPEAPQPSLFAGSEAEPELALTLPPGARSAPPSSSSLPPPANQAGVEAYRQVTGENATPSLPLQGVVQGKDQQGATVIQTPIGTLKVPVQAGTAERGTPVHLELLEIHLPPAPAHLAPPLPHTASPPLKNVPPALLQLFTHWQALEELTTTITNAAPDQPQVADTALKKFLPAADGQLAGKLMHFMQGLRSGNIQQWLGETLVKYLEQSGQQELLQNLKQDFQTLRTLWSDTAAQPGQWQTLIFPVYDGEQLHMARFFVRDYPEDSSRGEAQQKKRKGNATRFVVEVDLSQLGDMQLDGLVQPGTETAQFDLVIRTRRALPAEMQQDIQELFISSSAITGMEGTLQFSVHREFPVSPVQELLRQHRNDFTV